MRDTDPMEGTIKTILLQCPVCSGQLSGGDNDHVFFCDGCIKAFEPGERSLRELDLACVRQPETTQNLKLFHMPVWMFEVTATAAEASEMQTRKGSIFFGPGKVFVPAFKISSTIFGDPGISMTRAYYFERHKGNKAFIELTRPCQELPGAVVVDSAQASRLVESTLLSVIDPVVDVTGLRLKLIVNSKVLLSVWFREKGGRVGCMGISDEYPRSVFKGLIGPKENPDIGGGEPIPGV